MHKIIGLTGNIACGKSALGEILRAKGFSVLDSDEVVHKLYTEDKNVQEKIIQEFDTLDRKAIGQMVFGDSKEAKARRKILETIIHPAVDLEFRAWVKKHNHEALLFNLVPLIFEAKLEHRYDLIVTVIADENLQIARIKKRNPQLSEEEILKRIRSQMPQKEKAEKSGYVIDNSGSLEDLAEATDKLLYLLQSK